MSGGSLDNMDGGFWDAQEFSEEEFNGLVGSTVDGGSRNFEFEDAADSRVVRFPAEQLIAACAGSYFQSNFHVFSCGVSKAATTGRRCSVFPIAWASCCVGKSRVVWIPSVSKKGSSSTWRARILRSTAQASGN